MPPPTHRKLWLDLDCNLVPVSENKSHAEWANALGQELEALLGVGGFGIQITPDRLPRSSERSPGKGCAGAFRESV